MEDHDPGDCLPYDPNLLPKLWAKFLEMVRDAEWCTFEMDMDPLMDFAIELGLLERVAYNPEKHGEIEPAEPGDPIIHITELGQQIERQGQNGNLDVVP